MTPTAISDESAAPADVAGAVAVICAVGTERTHLSPLSHQGVLVAASGIGGAAARRRAAAVVATRPSVVIAAGFCGALDSGLRVGDVIVAERVRDHESGEEFECDPALVSATPGRRGTIVTVPRLVRTPAARAALDGALACDMESAHIVREATASGIRVVAVRAVTDETRHTLPDFDRLTDAAGRITPAFALAHFVLRPAELLRLLRLWPASRHAGRALVHAVEATVGVAR